MIGQMALCGPGTRRRRRSQARGRRGLRTSGRDTVARGNGTDSRRDGNDRRDDCRAIGSAAGGAQAAIGDSDERRREDSRRSPGLGRKLRIIAADFWCLQVSCESHDERIALPDGAFAV